MTTETTRFCRLCLIMLSVIAAIFMFTALTGCSSQAEPELRPFAANVPARYDTVDEATDTLYTLCIKQPEVLASTMSAFPSILEVADIDTTDPIAIDDLFDAAGGAAHQLVLVAGLSGVVLASDCRLENWSGAVDALYMYQRDPKKDATPANMSLAWRRTELEDAQILVLSVTHGSAGQRDYGYYLVSGGFQRVIPVLDIPATDSPIEAKDSTFQPTHVEHSPA